MKYLNLQTQFDAGLKEIPLKPNDFQKAINDIEEKLLSKESNSEMIKLLGQLGNCQRIVGRLSEAEKNLNKAISLSFSLGEKKLGLVNLIRLGNVKHWQREFTEAHRLFDECFEIISKENSLSEYLDFVYQHNGKCYFDENNYESAIGQFYKAILIRNNKSEIDLADSTLLAIEETKKRWLPQISPKDSLNILCIQNMPTYVREVLGKRHGMELSPARLNCINAALNFHGIECGRSRPFKPIELLHFLLERTTQIKNIGDFQFGDLIIWWNRSGGSWVHRKIIIDDMKFDDVDFPYGLIFDHVAVRVRPEVVFNKPNPSLYSEYKFDFLESASYPSKLGDGYEVTLHRVRG